MKRSTKLATAAIATATTIGLIATPANAATPDQGLYPQTGEIYLNPLATKILAGSPVGDIAGAAADLVNNTIGQATTVAALDLTHDLINGPLERPHNTLTGKQKFPGESTATAGYTGNMLGVPDSHPF